MRSEPRTRIFIVDDSAVMRALLRSVIAGDPLLEVVGGAGDGASAMDAIASVNPDLVLLDVEMPRMDGLETLRAIRARGSQIPVIMVSAVTQRGARVTIEALAGGASDYVTKPSNQADRDTALRVLSEDLLPKIRALTAAARSASVTGDRRSTLRFRSTDTPFAVVAIGASTGGPAALDVVLSALPASFPLPVLVVQHMPELFTGMLAERLGQRCELPVCEAREAMAVEPGRVYLARGDWHMEVVATHREPPALHLHQGPLENHCRPSVDVLFRSVAALYGRAALCVMLTGMGADGLASSRMVCAAGGMVLAQDQATSVIWGMPGAVAQAGLAQRVLPLPAITPEILRLCSKRSITVHRRAAVS